MNTICSYLTHLTQTLELSFKEREALLNEDVVMEDLTLDLNADDDSAFQTLPPGQEALFMSHSGGDEELLDDIMGQYRPRYVANVIHITPYTYITWQTTC